MSFLSLPEELVERILALCVLVHQDAPARPSWHAKSPARSTSSVLLVNKAFLRIATPLFYKTLVVRSAAQLKSLLDNALTPNPELGTYARNVIISGSYDGLHELVHLCQRLEIFDMTLDSTPWAEDVRTKFADSLPEMSGIKHLIVRKDAYLTQEKPKYMISQLTAAVSQWNALVSLFSFIKLIS